jgi:hypothetical protein
VAERCNLDGEALVSTSRLTAKIDTNCIADGFQIYLHSFIVAASGDWAVVQQGLNYDLKRLGSVLAVAYDRELDGFADFLLVENHGPRTPQTLAMVAEVIHGTPMRFSARTGIHFQCR